MFCVSFRFFFSSRLSAFYIGHIPLGRPTASAQNGDGDDDDDDDDDDDEDEEEDEDDAPKTVILLRPCLSKRVLITVDCLA